MTSPKRSKNISTYRKQIKAPGNERSAVDRKRCFYGKDGKKAKEKKPPPKKKGK